MPKGKEGILLMLGGPDFGKKKDESESKESDSEMSAEEMAAETLMKAVTKGKPKAVNEALKAWHEACYGSESESEESDEEPDEY